MDNSKDINSFLKDFCQPLPDSDAALLKEYGIKFENLEKDDNEFGLPLTQVQHIHRDKASLEDAVKTKLDAFQKKLFGDVSQEDLKKGEENLETFGIDKNQVESLEKLCEVAAKDLPELSPTSSFQQLKHSRSLTDQYNVRLPEWMPYSANEDTNEIEELQFLNNALEQLFPELSETVPMEKNTNQDKKIIGHTVEGIARILANPFPRVRMSKEIPTKELPKHPDTADLVECLDDTEKKIDPTSLQKEDIIKKEEKPNENNINGKKKKKGNEYVPKLVPINWSDPRSDPEFMNELEDFMKFDAFNFLPSNCAKPPTELDDMSEAFCLPTLPRDIIKMLSGTDEELANWEYSIKVEKGEATEEEDDSEIEEIEKELRNIKHTEKFMQFKKQEEKSEISPTINGPIDISEFLKVKMPPCVEDIVAKRDDEGNIISYETIPRNEEEVIREFERLHLGLESDTEEEEDLEDDPVDKTYEIDWEKEKTKIKSNKILGGLQGTISESELNANFQKIEEYIETCRNENATVIDPDFKKRMEEVNNILDVFGFPKQRDIMEDSLEKYLEAEVQGYDFMVKAHESRTCPPGNLVTEVKPGDADIHFITEQESSKPNEEIIKRPPSLVINLPGDSSGSVGEEFPETKELSSKEEVCKIPEETRNRFQRSQPACFLSDVEDFYSLTESITNEEILTNMGAELSFSEEQEEALDNEFKKEYFRRGGTLEGLGETAIPEQNLSLETLESYSKKFVTYPYISEHSGSFNFVRMRRILMTCFPELSDVLLSDLSKNEDLPTPVLDHLSDSGSSEDISLSFKPEPFSTEDLLEQKLQPDSENDSELPTDDENDNSDYDQPVPPPVISEQAKCKHVRKKRIRQSKSPGSSSSESESSDVLDTMTAWWAPFKARPVPSEEGVIDNTKKINELISKHKNFRVPKEMKKWIKDEYEPSKDDLRKWKKFYHHHFPKNSLEDTQLMKSENLNEYDALMREIENKFINNEEVNPIVDFKQLMEEQNKQEEIETNDMEPSIIDEIDGEYIVTETSANKVTTQENVEMKICSFEEEFLSESSKIFDENEEETVLLDKNFKIDFDINFQTPEEHSIKKDQEETEVSQPPKIPVIRLIDMPRPLRKEEWAEEVNSNAKIELTGTPAMSYPFELDGFQKHAIQALENGYNVFVSAHTSAGKTVVAEYAIAMSKQNRSKAVYTSPVKALSNQKYADFKRIFGSVGLITGDIQLNENAECLIMTTEILRSMLYNTSEKIRDLEFVVFDEVHYINDPERGHVWEEVLILLPPQVQIVMLSATVPNTLEFANWVGRTKQRKVMVCATRHRPVPLQHYVYTGTGGPSPGDTYLVKDGDGPFLIEEYGKAEVTMKEAQQKERKNRKKQQLKRAEEDKEWRRSGFSKPKPFLNVSDSQDKREQTLWISVVSFLQKKDWLPAVVFVFSRKKCDVFADILKTIDLTTKSEKSFIHRFIKSQVEKLDEVDQNLPQIKVMQSQLLQGIGVHHSGILPIMKEIVEVLFQEGKVKLLFATETFAMGVNMPARTVLFHSIKKYDGTETRLLHPAEYIQMAGRAGRRGKDSAGNVIILAKPTELIARHELETLMFGNPSKLISKFRLSYRMILNTLTMSGMLTVQSMMASSYCENQGQLKKKFVEKDLIEAEQFERTLKKKVINDVIDLDVDRMTNFYAYAHAYINKWKELRLKMIAKGRIMKELQPGRLLKICTGRYINRTALLLEVEPHKDPSINFIYRVMILDQDIQYTRDITTVGMEMDQEQLEEWYRLVSLMENLPPEKEILSGPNEYLELFIKPPELVAVCKETLKLPRNQIQEFLTQNSNRPNFRNKISETGDKIARQLWSIIGKTTDINEMNYGFEDFQLCLSVKDLCYFAEQMKKYAIQYNPLVLNSFKKVFRWKQAEEKVKILRMSLSDENMILYPDFKNKKALLKEKGYIDDSDTVQIKGYMAARVGKYELIVCELLVENILVNMEPEEVAALLSFLVCRSNNNDHYPTSFKTLTPSLQEGIKKCQHIIQDVILLEKQFQIEDYEGSETSKLSFGLVPIMYAWVKQEPFKTIMEMKELQEFEFQEGLLVRWIQQLLETLKEVEAAARVMGDPGVPTKLQAAGQRIKRGIVFAPSLYTTML